MSIGGSDSLLSIAGHVTLWCHYSFLHLYPIELRCALAERPADTKGSIDTSWHRDPKIQYF